MNADRATQGRAALVGREAELDVLVVALEAARGSDGRTVLVEGVAGIGKSRLLEEIAEIARRSGFLTLRATGDPLALHTAFGMLLELLEPLAAHTAAARERLFAGTAGLTLALLEPGHDADSAQAAPHVAHGSLRLLANAAEQQPLLVLIDDAQWADPASLRVLTHVAERIGRERIALVAALRRGEPPVDAPAMDRFRLELGTSVIELGAMAADELVALARGAGLDGADEQLAACAAASGGNPLLMTALARETDTRAAQCAAPTSVAAVGRFVEAQLRRLPSPAGELARMSAVLGDGASLHQAARLAGVDLDRAAAAADRLVETGILRGIDPIGFAHPVVRASLHDALPPARASRLHAAAARQLVADRADRERIAAHLLRALPARDPQVVMLLREAAAQAGARGVPASAIRYLERALAEPPRDWQMGETLLELGRAQAQAGLPAADVLTRAIDVLTDPRQRALALLWLGRTRFAAGVLAEAAEAFDRGLAELAAADGGDPDAEPQDDLATELRAGYISAARFATTLRAEAQRRLEPLLAQPEAGASPAERALLAEVALERGIRGAPPATAVALALRAWADGRILDELDAQGIVLSQIAATLTWSDALDESERVLDAAIAHAERTGAAHQLATAAYLRAWPRYYRGRLGEAQADAERALATEGWMMYEPAARAVVALVALERGDPARAQATLDVPDAAERWAGSIPYALLLEAQGRMLMVRGEDADALRAFERCGELIGAMETGHPFCPWRSQAALALHRQGAAGRARDLAAEEVALARQLGLARPLGGALRAAGLVAADAETALASLRASVQVLDSSPARLERARSLVALGAALRRTDDVVAARGTLRDALGLAHELGAIVLEERARAELVAAGSRPRRSASDGVAALTPTERRIARLAADGLTNRQIGEELVVVPKTVQFHLTNVYRKLAISGRDALADALRDGHAG